MTADTRDLSRRTIFGARLILAATACSVVLLPAKATAQEAEPIEADTATDESGPRIGHGDKGFEFETADGRYLLQIQARLRVRLQWDVSF